MMKKYLQFLKESNQNRYEYGCVMVDYNFSNWSELLQSINQDDLYEVEGKNYGLQTRPHLTLLYGIHEEVTDDQILKCFDGFTEDDFKVQIDGVSIFENPEFEVVKLEIDKSSKLQEINRRLSELPNSNQFPEYKPHITLAYVKKGKGQRYIDPNYKYQIKNIARISYTRPDKSELKIEL
jgi:2'-5' RNA ligase